MIKAIQRKDKKTIAICYIGTGRTQFLIEVYKCFKTDLYTTQISLMITKTQGFIHFPNNLEPYRYKQIAIKKAIEFIKQNKNQMLNIDHQY